MWPLALVTVQAALSLVSIGGAVALPRHLALPTRGPHLTARKAWSLLSEDVSMLPADARLEIMKVRLAHCLAPS